MSRKAARETAMKLIFSHNFGGGSFIGEEDELFFSRDPEGEAECYVPTPEESAFIDALVQGTEGEMEQINRVIDTHSIGWKRERMPKVDLTILQLSVYELLYTDIGVSVAINEAVELAKKYATADSASFINGLLAQVVKEKQK